MTACRRGFTIVELLITLGLAGLLAAALVPRLARMMARSKEASTRPSDRPPPSGDRK